MARHGALQSAATSPQQADRDSDGAEVLTQVEVCARLGISDQTWMRWRAAKRTPEPVTMPSGRLKWRTADIDALAGNEAERPGRRRFFATSARHDRSLTAGLRVVKSPTGASTERGR